MIEIIEAGPLATVQDLGRTGYRDLGVSRSGAADRAAHQLANRLVGNPVSAATIEITLGGLGIRLPTAATIAFTGARCPGTPAWNSALSLPAGTSLQLGRPASGLRSYLAVRGGLAARQVLGSRSTDTLSGLGPARLAAGDRLPIGQGDQGGLGGDVGRGGDLGRGGRPGPSDEVVLRPAGNGPLRAMLGPRADWFEPDALGLLTGTSWLVLPASDRIGTRLDGPPLRRSRTGELPPEPTLPGAIQVPPDGRPIVLGPDAPVTGGYPVIAVLLGTDGDRLAQCRPGDRVQLMLIRG